jgi:hypothetical protein
MRDLLLKALTISRWIWARLRPDAISFDLVDDISCDPESETKTVTSSPGSKSATKSGTEVAPLDLCGRKEKSTRISSGNNRILASFKLPSFTQEDLNREELLLQNQANATPVPPDQAWRRPRTDLGGRRWDR